MMLGGLKCLNEERGVQGMAHGVTTLRNGHIESYWLLDTRSHLNPKSEIQNPK